mmetsp:Transcript_4733/g.11999  ORF Transcript_4733/g.11999 Transcript_4733/m.11999 type:complete len:251 (-) Transcript_4733:223-975(-)
MSPPASSGAPRPPSSPPGATKLSCGCRAKRSQRAPIKWWRELGFFFPAMAARPTVYTIKACIKKINLASSLLLFVCCLPRRTSSDLLPPNRFLFGPATLFALPCSGCSLGRSSSTLDHILNVAHPDREVVLVIVVAPVVLREVDFVEGLPFRRVAGEAFELMPLDRLRPSALEGGPSDVVAVLLCERLGRFLPLDVARADGDIPFPLRLGPAQCQVANPLGALHLHGLVGRDHDLLPRLVRLRVFEVEAP